MTPTTPSETSEPAFTAAPPEQLSGAQIVVRLLERQGINTVTGIPGGAILPIYDALSQSVRIHHVLARHEQGAGFIAQGMARTTGQPAVCLASSGPGATNLLTALADAKLDSIPLVAITGQVPQAMIGTDAFQEVDTYGLSIPITKHNFLVSSAEELSGNHSPGPSSWPPPAAPARCWWIFPRTSRTPSSRLAPGRNRAAPSRRPRPTAPASLKRQPSSPRPSGPSSTWGAASSIPAPPIWPWPWPRRPNCPR